MSGVDRAALIEAAAEALQREEWSANLPGFSLSETVLDAVLPLVTQAIDQKAAFWGQPGALAIADAARLVRSLAEEGQQQ